MIIPNVAKAFGSRSHVAVIQGYHYYISLIISRTYKKALNQISEPCTVDKSPNTSACIAKWIQDKIGCRIKIHGYDNQDKLRQCSSRSQVQDLYKILSKLKFADSKIIHEETGCLASCERSEYKRFEPSTVGKNPFSLFNSCKSGILPCNLKLTLEIPEDETTYEGTKQYVVYDSISFFADVGGFMGLLLGFSILSIYDELENLLRTRIVGQKC